MSVCLSVCLLMSNSIYQCISVSFVCLCLTFILVPPLFESRSPFLVVVCRLWVRVPLEETFPEGAGLLGELAPESGRLSPDPVDTHFKQIKISKSNFKL